MQPKQTLSATAISGQTFDYIVCGGGTSGCVIAAGLASIPDPQLNARKLVFLRGKQIGGSSAVNYMALARGPAADYDEWAKMVGDDGWKWENIFPLMKQVRIST
ncbi:hypothetical protein AFLA70_520g000691 [Aspergillus flavus AF70]|nr:hypothetical protein AFLA70_520g000691 [Aspergillus flavus AF70]